MKRQIHAYRGHERDRGRRPQHQARPRRHPRDRVLRADPAAHRRRPPSGTARPRDAGDARRARRGRLDRAPRRATISAAAYRFLRTRRAPAADGRRRADPHAAGAIARALERFARFCRLRGSRRASPRRCSAICARCSANTRRCSRDAPAAEAARPCVVVPGRRRRPRNARPARRHGLQAAARSLGDGAAAGSSGGYRVAARRACARPSFAELVPLLLDAIRALRESRRGAACLRPLSIGPAWRGAGCSRCCKQNPDLVALIALMLGTAPRLADILAQLSRGDGCAARAELLRRAAGRGEARRRSSSVRSSEARSYEDFLDRLRMFAQEQMFLIGARILSGTVSAEQAGEAFARLADVLVRALHRAVEDDVRRRSTAASRASRPRCWRSASSAAAR